MSYSYCIVGGGVSGLVAAYRLRQAMGVEAEITLFDPADRLGGILRTETLCGAMIDIGAEAFVARRPEVPALLNDVGLADRQIGTSGVRPMIFGGGRLHPLPADTVNGIPSSSASMVGLVDEPTVAQISSEPSRVLEWDRESDPTVGALVSDRFGEQVVSRSVDPMLAGVYAGSAATIGIRSAVPTVAAELDAGAGNLSEAVRRALPASTAGPVFGAVAGGYQVLVDELVRHSGLQWVQARVDGIGSGDPGWVLSDDRGSEWHADAVVLAVPATRLASLVGRVAPRTAAAAERIPVASAAVLALALPGGTGLPADRD